MFLKGLRLGALLCASGIACAAACGDGVHGFAKRDGGSDSGPDVPNLDIDGSLGDVEEPDGSCSQCSSDLHNVLDCEGNVIRTCPEDQGCAGDTCVPACESAEANQSTYGCDYFVADPAEFVELTGSCFAAYIANTWTSPVTLNVEFEGEVLDPSTFAYLPSGSGKDIVYDPLPDGQIPPGQVAIVFLAYHSEPVNNIACPPGITAAITDHNVKLTGTGMASAFHISTDRPVVAYDIYPYGGGPSAVTSATLLIPTSAWDTNYIAQSGYPKNTLGHSGEPFVQIVAKEDGTVVTISPTVAIVGGGGVSGTSAGEPIDYYLDRGQILQLSQANELTGSAIGSNKPIGVWGGHSCFNVDTNEFACDSAHQQIPPVKAMGHEYVAVRYRNREDGKEETVPWRIVGAVDGTELIYEPEQPVGAPSTINQGEIAKFMSTGPFTVRSQDELHPFYMSAHMTGASAHADRGDPEWVNIVPPQQYLTKYIFFTDPTYPETNLVLVRSRAGGTFRPVFLDCLGEVSGWEPADSSGNYEYTRVDLVRHNFQGQDGCDNGFHELTSDAPFGLTVWGWGSNESIGFPTTYVSYAYAGGMSVKPINSVVVPPIPR